MTAVTAVKTVDPRTLAKWRQWLAGHHDSASEVWLVFHKRHTGRPSVPYEDAIREALCFGWVDSLIKRLKEETRRRRLDEAIRMLTAGTPLGMK